MPVYLAEKIYFGVHNDGGSAIIYRYWLHLVE